MGSEALVDQEREQQARPPGQAEDLDSVEAQSKRSAVRRWQERVKNAKRKWEPDFKRMRMNMEFTAGMQWPSMQTIDGEQYVCNWTVQNVNQKVASLYARNPQADVRKRKRRLFQVWDEKLETLAEAVQKATILAGMGMGDPASEAIILDFEQGRQIEQMIDKVCDTLKILYQYEIDSCRPEFKEQMKQAVRRAVICGVAYGRPIFKREAAPVLSSVDVRQSLTDRAKRAKLILDKIEQGELEESDPQLDTLRSLFASMQTSTQGQDEYGLPEQLVYDFPTATSIIPDERCRSLKEFVGARFVAQEYLLPIEEINAFFETNIKPSGDVTKYSEAGEMETASPSTDTKDTAKKPIACLWEIFDYTTKTHCFVCDGHKDYVVEPEALEPCVSGFYPLFALTFNDIESADGTKTSIYPPSDVQLVKHVQKEWNRSREGLRKHRKANQPNYVVPDGHLTKQDKESLMEAEPNQVIELQGLPLGTEPGKILQPLMKVPIEPELYDTQHLAEDMQLAGRVQEANLGPAQPNVTATVGTIAEQSRMTVSSSNVDDLDGFLSRMARAGMEMLLRDMSVETVKHIVGPGAVWPVQQREDFINAIDMEIQAASSGRPNKAIEIANMERLAPYMMQAGANPMAMLREFVKRLDDRLDPKDFFPVPGLPSGPQGQQQGTQTGGSNSGQVAAKQPLPQIGSGQPVPLVAS